MENNKTFKNNIKINKKIEKSVFENMKECLFTIVLLHYDQFNYIKHALDSIFIQDYQNIELIIADDCSPNLRLEELKEYIDNNKKDNIKNVIYQINEANLGTTKSLNKAIKSSSGKYILTFAADDALYDKHTISNFVNAFENINDDNVYMLFAQALMMDETLTKFDEFCFSHNFARDFNQYDHINQFRSICMLCFIPMGATAMRADMFEKFGPFDENYIFVEDWSYFIKLTRSGGKMRYADFNALYHRSGGTSHYDKSELVPKNVLKYQFDLLNILKREIFPYISLFSTSEKIQILKQYKSSSSHYSNMGGTKICISSYEMFKFVPILLIKVCLWRMLNKAPKKINICLHKMANIATIWISTILFENKFNLPQNLNSFINILNLYIFPIIELLFLIILIPYISIYWLHKIKKCFRRMRSL